jgi:uncharacterized protein (TIGR00369 family)
MELDRTREELRKRFHSRCIFNGNPITAGMEFDFAADGSLNSVFMCGKQHQGYDGMVHGGVIAAIIDASMAQCLMGHGKVGYTTDLAIRYRKPLTIGRRARLKTSITEQKVGGLLVFLKTEIEQHHALAIRATGRFYISDTYEP